MPVLENLLLPSGFDFLPFVLFLIVSVFLSFEKGLMVFFSSIVSTV